MPLSSKEGSVLDQFNLLLKAAEDVPALFVQMEAMFHKLMGPDLKKIRFLVLDQPLSIAINHANTTSEVEKLKTRKVDVGDHEMCLVSVKQQFNAKLKKDRFGAMIRDEEETDFENFNPMFNDVFALGNAPVITKNFILLPIFKPYEEPASSFKIVEPRAPSVILQLETKEIDITGLRLQKKIDPKRCQTIRTYHQDNLRCIKLGTQVMIECLDKMRSESNYKFQGGRQRGVLNMLTSITKARRKEELVKLIKSEVPGVIGYEFASVLFYSEQQDCLVAYHNAKIDPRTGKEEKQKEMLLPYNLGLTGKAI